MVQLRPSPATERPPRRRPRPAWAMAAALVVIAAIAIPAFLLGGSSDDTVDVTTTTIPQATTTTQDTTPTVVEPDILGALFAEPGMMVDITPPDGRPRGVGYSLAPFGSAVPTFWLIASADGYDGEAQWGPWEDGSAFPGVSVTGPGRDAVVIPDSAPPGEYLLCQIDGAFCWTLELVESTVRSFTIDPAAVPPVDLPAAEAIDAGWGNGEFDLGLSETGFGPCCFDVTSDGGVVFLDAHNQRLMHWPPGRASVFALATFQPSEFVAHAVAVGHDDRIYVLGASNRPGRPHDLLIIGLDGSVDGPYETLVESNADLQATANGIYAGHVLIDAELVDGWIPIATPSGTPVPLTEQQPVAELPVDDRSLRIDFAADGTIISTLHPGGDSIPIEYHVPGEYFLVGSFLQNQSSTIVLVMGTVWSADEAADFLVVRAAVEADEAVSEVYRIPGQNWAEMGAFGTVRLEGSSLYFMSTTPDGPRVARYELPG